MRKLLLASAATMGALLVTIGGAQAQPVTAPAPGTIAVHLNGYLQFGVGYYGSTDNTVHTSTGTSKLNPYTDIGDARLYAGFDAATLSGVQYGAQIELRTTASDAGNRAGLTTGSSGSAGTTSFYVKRAYGYLGTGQAGYVRLGQTDSAFTLLQTGVLEGYGDGAQFNSDGGIFNALPSDAEPGTFVYADSSHLYSTGKVVYLSPTIAGFSIAAGFEPNSDGLKEGTAACTNAGSAAINPYSTSTAETPICGAIASSPYANSSFRRNTIDAAIEYAETTDGFANKANVGILNAAPVEDTAAGAEKFSGMTVYQVGAQTSYAGFTVGANVKWGSVENSYTFKPVGARDALDYIIGGTYTIGPWVAGASFIDGQSAGAYTPTSKTIARTLTEYGVAAGGNYVFGKDLSLYLQYEYGHRHQPGNPGLNISNPENGNSQFQVIATGATFKW